MQEQPLPEKTTDNSPPKVSNTRHDRRFKSFLDGLKMYITTHGHMDVSKHENKDLFTWIGKIKKAYKRMQEGRNPLIKLTPERMDMLREINFDFECNSLRPFEDGIKALRLYKEEHGHTNVSKKQDESLHNWVMNIRKSSKSIRDGLIPTIKLTPDHIEMLHQIGFQFECKSSPFEAGIKSLKLYKEKHGHMCVSEEEDESLNRFIKQITQSAKRMQKGLKPQFKLSSDRIKILQDIGFDLDFKLCVGTFEGRLEALKLYQEKHGHMNVSQREDKLLHDFVRHVKQSFNRTQKGKKPIFKLTEDQINMLREIGFDFKFTAKIPFEDRIEALELYKEEHGHIKVPRWDDQALHDFLKHARRSISLMQDGRKPGMKLTPDRIAALKTIGVWAGPDPKKPMDKPKRERPLTIGISPESVKHRKVTKRVEPTGSSILGLSQNPRLGSALQQSLATEGNCTKKVAERKAPRGPSILGLSQSPRLGSALQQPLVTEGNCTKKVVDREAPIGPTILGLSQNPRLGSASQQPLVAEGNRTTSIANDVIGKQFIPKKSIRVPFESRIEALKLYQEKHGHMDITAEEDKSLFNFVTNIKSSARRMQKGQRPPIALTSDRVIALIEIRFFHFSTVPKGNYHPACIPNNLNRKRLLQFESFAKELKLYIEMHGHMNVLKNENKALHHWIENIRSTFKRIQEGQNPNTVLTPDRMIALAQMGFDFQSTHCTSRPFTFEQNKHEQTSITREITPVANEKEDMEDIEGDVIRRINFGQEKPKQISITKEITVANKEEDMEEIEGDVFRQIDFEQDQHEYASIPKETTVANENEDMEEIEGDIVPRWLISDEKEDDNDNSLLDDIHIEIDGETEIGYTW